MKWELLAWALGDSWRTLITSFLTAKDAIWKRMGFRSAVAKRQCDQIMALSGYCGVWTRSVQLLLLYPLMSIHNLTLCHFVTICLKSTNSQYVNMSCRHRHQSHSGAVRRVGEDQYIPRGPGPFTASFRSCLFFLE